MDKCGYKFVIITSEKMTAAQALGLYKSTDVKEQKEKMTVPAAIRELEKIEIQKELVLKAKDRYETKLNKLEKVMRFLSGNEVDDE